MEEDGELGAVSVCAGTRALFWPVGSSQLVQSSLLPLRPLSGRLGLRCLWGAGRGPHTACRTRYPNSPTAPHSRRPFPSACSQSPNSQPSMQPPPHTHTPRPPPTRSFLHLPGSALLPWCPVYAAARQVSEYRAHVHSSFTLYRVCAPSLGDISHLP